MCIERITRRESKREYRTIVVTHIRSPKVLRGMSPAATFIHDRLSLNGKVNLS